MNVIADVKCYYCGHVSGQITGPSRSALKLTAFAPRPGYTKPQPRAGQTLRCERCNGPVYLEDVSPMSFSKVAAPTQIHPRKTAPAKKRAA
jgi:hypothetical protein